MNRNIAVSSLLVMASMSFVVTAQTLQLFPSAVAPAIVHTFSNGIGTDTQAFTFTNSAVHLRDYTTIRLTINAPVGQAWLVAPPKHGPTQQDLPELTLDLSSLITGQAMGAPFAQINSSGLDFDFVLGGATLVSSPGFFSLIPAGANSFSTDGSAAVNGDIAFTNLTLTVSFDNSLLADAALEAALEAKLAFSYHGLSSDPGQQMTVIPVPAPTPLLWQIVRFPNESQILVFSWTNSIFSLQAAPTATGLFTNIPGATSPYAVSAAGARLFFRLQAD